MKPYAIITLDDLKVRTFDNRDDWQTAIEALTKNGKTFIPLKYHHGAATYQQPEMHAASW